MPDVEKGVIRRHSTAQANQRQKHPEVYLNNCEPGLHSSRVIRLPFLSSFFPWEWRGEQLALISYLALRCVGIIF